MGTSGATDFPEAIASNGFEHLNVQDDLLRSSQTSDGTENVDQSLDGMNGPSEEEFLPMPSDNQSILVGLSSVCMCKRTVCERSRFFHIKYNGNFDKPLERFLRDNLFDQAYRCPSCAMPSEAHEQCYTHRQGTLTISIKKLTKSPLQGERDIWMWHSCLKCPSVNDLLPETQRAVMSDEARGLSFGKFLELSFFYHATASGVANCKHSLHHDCLRFYGCGKMVARFRYVPINIHKVYLPPAKLVFRNGNQEWIQNEVHEVDTQAKLLFSEILNALTQQAENKLAKTSVDSSLNMPQSRCHIADLTKMLQKEKAKFEESLDLHQKDKTIIDILEINRLRRQLHYISYVWAHQLAHVASVMSNSPRGDLMNFKSENTNKPAGKTVARKQIHPEVIDIETQVVVDSSPKEQYEVSFDKFDSLIGNTRVHWGVSERQASVMASLSDTLDAGCMRNHPGSVLIDSGDKGDHGEDNTSSLLSLASTARGSESIEDSSDIFNDFRSVYIPSYHDSELRGGARMLKAMGSNDTVVPVYDDEPTSIISHALLSNGYVSQMSGSGKLKDRESIFASQSGELQARHCTGIIPWFSKHSEMKLESVKADGTESLLDFLHARVEFADEGPLGKVKYAVTCYHAERFEALRRKCCPKELDYIRSLSRSKKWAAQGGKSNVYFAKTLDDRFIIKEVTKEELAGFSEFAPAYFKYLFESIGTGSPTCLAKILGIYQMSWQMEGGKETKMNVLVMENLLFGRNLTRLYDLKGSLRSRYNPDSSGSNKVLLDQNLIGTMPKSPISVGMKAKRLLDRAVWNDTNFLASANVMDYSLLVGVDEDKQELVLGIIDFMRQYTWDKQFETWVKSSGILVGLKGVPPTVISPKRYKTRFRKAMATYFPMVPDHLSPGDNTRVVAY